MFWQVVFLHQWHWLISGIKTQPPLHIFCTLHSNNYCFWFFLCEPQRLDGYDAMEAGKQYNLQSVCWRIIAFTKKQRESSKVCFELINTFRITPKTLLRVAPPKSGNLFRPAVIISYSLCLIPYFCILPYNVVRPMPSSSAASVRLPSPVPKHGGFVSSPCRLMSTEHHLPM